jgi:hypothetical protein
MARGSLLSMVFVKFSVIDIAAKSPTLELCGGEIAMLHLLPLWEKVPERSEGG